MPSAKRAPKGAVAAPKSKQPKQPPPDAFKTAGEEFSRSLRARKPAAAAAAPAAESGGSWETDQQAPFSRGGGSALTPLEHKEIAQEARSDALFQDADDAGASAASRLGLGAAEPEGGEAGASVDAHWLRRHRH